MDCVIEIWHPNRERSVNPESIMLEKYNGVLSQNDVVDFLKGKLNGWLTIQQKAVLSVANLGWWASGSGFRASAVFEWCTDGHSDSATIVMIIPKDWPLK